MKNPFRKPSETDKRIAAVQAELKAARAALAAIDASKAAAQGDGVVFAKWSADRNAAALEVDRLTDLIETYETDAEAARKSEADAAARRQVAEARFILKRALLVRQRKVAMAIHPLGQVFLVLLLAILLWTLARRVHRWVPSHLSRPPHGRRLGRNHGRCCRQQHGSESWS